MADHEMDSQLTSQETKNVTALEGPQFKKRKVQARSGAAGSSAHHSAGTPEYPFADTLADHTPYSSADSVADPATNPSAEASSEPSAEPPSQHILSLPNEVLLAIFSFLDITNLPSVLGVCSRWREVITSSQSWQTLDFTAVKESDLHVKVAMAVGHQARKVLGAAPLGKVVEQVLRNCPNLVELSMPDAIIKVKILRDIIAMCPMIESITTCVRVFTDRPADTPSLMRIIGKVNMDFSEDANYCSAGSIVANYCSAGSIVNNVQSFQDILMLLHYESGICNEDYLLLNALLDHPKAIFCILKECTGRFSSLSLAAIVERHIFPTATLWNAACNIKDFIGVFRYVLPSEEFVQMQAMTNRTKVIFKYGSPTDRHLLHQY